MPFVALALGLLPACRERAATAEIGDRIRAH
jgi:hypothetical protein